MSDTESEWHFERIPEGIYKLDSAKRPFCDKLISYIWVSSKIE